MNTLRPTTGFAVVYKGGLPYTDAPEIIGGGAIYQVYKTEEDALKFLEVKFGDAVYEIRPVVIFDVADVHTDEAIDV